MNRNREIEERYLGGQTPTEFLQAGGDEHEYAALVFSGAVFGPGENPAAPDLGVDTADDLAEALAEILAPARARLAALAEHRAGTQFQPLDPASPAARLELRVPANLIAAVDRAAGAAGVTRSAWVRAAIERALDGAGR